MPDEELLKLFYDDIKNEHQPRRKPKRKLKARWSEEVLQDLTIMHGNDVEEEMMDQMGREIQAEIDREILLRIQREGMTDRLNGTVVGGITG